MTLHDTVDVIIKEAIRLDHQAIAAALVTALEGERKSLYQCEKCNGCELAMECEAVIADRAFNQALDQAITIVKELLTPTV